MNPKIPVKSLSVPPQKLPTAKASTIHDAITAATNDPN
jgi:hypothetical protein